MWVSDELAKDWEDPLQGMELGDALRDRNVLICLTCKLPIPSPLFLCERCVREQSAHSKRVTRCASR